MGAIFQLYKDSFSGLSREVWLLSLVTLINRAGTMVIPFLSVYMIVDLEFDYSQTGWVLMSFGLGSMLGSFLGGKLSDWFGFYPVMLWSLIATGICFFVLQYCTDFISFSIGVFICMVVADTFRPALFTSLEVYAKPENRTRSLSLIRLAINFGFSLGPFIGGLIITGVSYTGLFYIDAITCVLAGLFLYKTIPYRRRAKVSEQEKLIPKGPKPFENRNFILLMLGVFIMAFVFLQFFSTVPLYFKEIYELNEFQIGLLMTLNGLLIVLFEMPLIHKLDTVGRSKAKLIALAILMIAVSYGVYIVGFGIGVLIISVVLMSFGEMLGFPFSNSLAMNLAPKARMGAYMGVYSMTFSVAHVLSPKLGLEIINRYGYTSNWIFLFVISVLGALLMYTLKKNLAD